MPDNEDPWTAYTKGVKPIKRPAGKNPPKPATRKNAAPVSVKNISQSAVRVKTTVHGNNETNFHAPLDRNLERRLRQGSIAIEARLDLHGLYQKEAHEALNDFMANSLRADRRCLLIITGKGRGEGVLRANLAGWLSAAPFAPHILALRTASIRHGGAGAFYVLLRRKNETRFTK